MRILPALIKAVSVLTDAAALGESAGLAYDQKSVRKKLRELPPAVDPDDEEDENAKLLPDLKEGETLDLVKQVEFMSLFTFIYSPRKGTPAAEMPDPVSRKEKGVWFSELLEVQEQISRNRNANLVGKEVILLCEEVVGEGLLSGKALTATEVLFQGDKSLLGKTVKVKIEKFTNLLEGKIIEE